MKKILQAIGFTTMVFAVFGIALGLLGYISGSWAQSQLITDAGGAAEFGPVFVAVAYLQTAVVIFLLGPVVAGLAASILGALLSTPKAGFVAGGTASLVGFYVMSIVALGILVLSKGPDAQQAFSFTQALGPMLLAGIPTAIIGSLLAALSAAAN